MHATLDRVDWPAVRARVFGRLDPLHESAVVYIHPALIEVVEQALLAP